MSDCHGQSNLKQHSKQLILLLSTSSFLQILKLRGHTKPVEDIINSENEDTTDGQATIGYLLAQARDCWPSCAIALAMATKVIGR